MDSFSAQDYLEYLPKMAQSIQETNSHMMDVYCNGSKDLFFPMSGDASERRPPSSTTAIYTESSQDVFVATEGRLRKARAVSYTDEDMDDVFPTDERSEPVMCMSFQQMAEKATSWFLGDQCAVPRIDYIVPSDDDIHDFENEDAEEEEAKRAEEEGLDTIFKQAGFEWRDPGCSMCLGMNPDRLEPGERCASTSNRNFEGRQGPGARTLLASPLTAAACAITGEISDVRNYIGEYVSQ